jgi:hypothetical protein
MNTSFDEADFVPYRCIDTATKEVNMSAIIPNVSNITDDALAKLGWNSSSSSVSEFVSKLSTERCIRF